MVSSSNSSQRTFTIVSQTEAKQVPYPYVYVNHDGSVRELRPGERTFLETPFLPGDGGRPAIKHSYSSQNGWGSIRGFCKRSNIPSTVEIQQTDPVDADPAPDAQQDN